MWGLLLLRAPTHLTHKDPGEAKIVSISNYGRRRTRWCGVDSGSIPDTSTTILAVGRLAIKVDVSTASFLFSGLRCAKRLPHLPVVAGGGKRAVRA